MRPHAVIPRALHPARLAPALLAALCSCATQRVLEVTSEPPGALVRLDDRTVGTTPVDVPFDAYGVRRLTLYLEGWRTHSERLRIDPPWWERFPLDVVSEVLLPFGWRDERSVHVRLEPGSDVVTLPALESVFQRAEILRRAGPEGPEELPTPIEREVPAGATPPPAPGAGGAGAEGGPVEDEPRR